MDKDRDRERERDRKINDVKVGDNNDRKKKKSFFHMKTL